MHSTCFKYRKKSNKKQKHNSQNQNSWSYKGVQTKNQNKYYENSCESYGNMFESRVWFEKIEASITFPNNTYKLTWKPSTAIASFSLSWAAEKHLTIPDHSLHHTTLTQKQALSPMPKKWCEVSQNNLHVLAMPHPGYCKSLACPGWNQDIIYFLFYTMSRLNLITSNYINIFTHTSTDIISTVNGLPSEMSVNLSPLLWVLFILDVFWDRRAGVLSVHCKLNQLMSGICGPLHTHWS